MAKAGKPEVRIKLVSIRVTGEEHERLFARARRSGVTISQFARRLLLEEAAGFGLSKAPAPDEHLPASGIPLSPEAHETRQLADQIRRVGINLNQIAHRLNMLDQPMPGELPEVLEDIRRYVQLVWARKDR